MTFIDQQAGIHRRISAFARSEELTFTGEYRHSSIGEIDIHRRISAFIDQEELTFAGRWGSPGGEYRHSSDQDKLAFAGISAFIDPESEAFTRISAIHQSDKPGHHRRRISAFIDRRGDIHRVSTFIDQRIDVTGGNIDIQRLEAALTRDRRPLKAVIIEIWRVPARAIPSKITAAYRACCMLKSMHKWPNTLPLVWRIGSLEGASSGVVLIIQPQFKTTWTSQRASLISYKLGVNT
ncbi:hypothetical protein AVEN_162175-1 [Araneus ventricosus]|uniref:Uncharacterized protein n=1 Tax=Araneus ventricosus TaxID=182803 RepID=A0A4Y2GXV6_ARAVE|nr:hypothetical protein AVEN_162175-1 [Araneus ventricosus]